MFCEPTPPCTCESPIASFWIGDFYFYVHDGAVSMRACESIQGAQVQNGGWGAGDAKGSGVGMEISCGWDSGWERSVRVW